MGVEVACSRPIKNFFNCHRIRRLINNLPPIKFSYLHTVPNRILFLQEQWIFKARNYPSQMTQSLDRTVARMLLEGDVLFFCVPHHYYFLFHDPLSIFVSITVYGKARVFHCLNQTAFIAIFCFPVAAYAQVYMSTLIALVSLSLRISTSL